MLNTDVWPPKPDLPDPLTEYDAVIAAKIAAFPAGESGQMQFRLIKALFEEGVEIRQAIAIVRSYGVRHGGFAETKIVRFLSLVNVCIGMLASALAFFNVYLGHQRGAILRLPHHHAAFLALRKEELFVVYTIVALAVLNIPIFIIRLKLARKK